MYGASCETDEDYLRMAESIRFETMSRFYRAVVTLFGKDYLRAPTKQETARILAQKQEDVLGCLGASIVCIGVRTTM
jgi:hypothetical protein